MTDNTAFLKKINWQLFIVLFLMTGCFFTWSENIVITRGIKVVGRVGVLFATYAIYNRILEYGAVDTLKWKNILSPILYVGIFLSKVFFYSISTSQNIKRLILIF